MAKSKYETHVQPYLERIEWWVKMGASQEEVADKLHIACSTLSLYLAKGRAGEAPYSEISECFARGCGEPDDTVEAALYKRAKGIEYEEQTFERKPNPETGQYEEVCTKRVTKFIPPDPRACEFWLTNRRPNKWKYKPEPVDEDGESGGVVVLAPVMETPGPPEEDSDG